MNTLQHIQTSQLGNYLKLIIALLSIGLFVISCDSEDSASENDTTNSVQTSQLPTAPITSSNPITADQPADSTGQYASVDLNFGTIASSGINLVEPSVLTLENGMVITDARINIRSIKLKADKELSAEEDALRDALKEKKKELEAEIETAKEEFEVALEDLKQSYEPLYENAEDDGAKDLLKEQFKDEEAVIKEQIAALEDDKDAAEAEYEAELDGNIKWKGPYVYNLVNKSVSPELPSQQMIDGSYKRIEFKVQPNRTLEGTDALLNNSVVVIGTVTINNVDTDFHVAFPFEEKFRLMGAGSFGVEVGTENSLTVAFDINSWFELIDMSTATIAADGVIHINKDENISLYDQIRKNIKASTKFGEDEDGDGELEEDEADGDGKEALDDLEAEEDEDEDEDEEEEEEED